MKWSLFQISATGIIAFKPVGVAGIIRLLGQTGICWPGYSI
jgi:hypothetical protein